MDVKLIGKVSAYQHYILSGGGIIPDPNPQPGEDVSKLIAEHNVDADAHEDIREQIVQLSNKQPDLSDYYTKSETTEYVDQSLDNYIQSIFAGSYSERVFVKQTGMFSVDLPSSMHGLKNINVYHNGGLLVEGYHYNLVDNKIELLMFPTHANDIFIFDYQGIVLDPMLQTGLYHSHDNKPILDTITQQDIDKWNSGGSFSQIDVFKVNGQEVPIIDKTVSITIPTKPEDIGAANLIHTHAQYVKTTEIFEGGKIKPALLPETLGLELGETETTAFRGDWGMIAYDHALEHHAIPTAQENVIESIMLAGAVLPAVDKQVVIPVANEAEFGVVKSSFEDNKVLVEEDGTMSVNKLTIDKLYVPEDLELVLVSGDPV